MDLNSLYFFILFYKKVFSLFVIFYRLVIFRAMKKSLYIVGKHKAFGRINDTASIDSSFSLYC